MKKNQASTTMSTTTRTNTGRRARRRGGLRGIRALYSVGLVVLIAAVGQTLAPWITGPDDDVAEIDARWAELEASAAPEFVAADASLLFPALEELERSSLNRGPIDDETRLDPPARRAVDHLVEWERRGGGVGHGVCGDLSLRAFTAYRLGHLALHAAEGVRHPEFTAAVQLGLQLRDRGSMIKALVGQSLLLEALEIVGERGWALPDVLYRERPTETHVRSILAREAFCGPLYWEQGIAAGHVKPAHLAETPLERAIAAVAFDQEREVLYLRAVRSERMLKALATSDPARHYGKLVPPREAEVPSLLVRETEASLDILRQPERSFARYNEALLQHANIRSHP